MVQRQQATQAGLLSLPAELRLQIYDHLFADRPQARTFYVFGDKLYRWPPWKPSKAPKCAILYVCRLLYLEALPSYIEATQFSFTCWGPAPNFKDRFKGLGTLYDFPLARIRRMKLILEATSDEDVSALTFSVRELMYALRHCRAIESLVLDVTVAPDHMSEWSIDRVFQSLRIIKCAGKMLFELHSWGRGRSLPEYRLLKVMCEELRPCVLHLRAGIATRNTC